MTSIVVWMLALTISLALTILSAAAGLPAIHTAVTAFVTLAIAIVAVQADRGLQGSAAPRSARAACTARFIGLGWVWAGTAIFATYQFVLHNWPEWWQFSTGLLIAGGLSVVLSNLLQRDADAGREDEGLLKTVRALNVVQIVGMLIAAIGLVADHKFTLGMGTLRPDWAANNIFFFGALAIACIGVHALAAETRAASGGAA